METRGCGLIPKPIPIAKSGANHHILADKSVYGPLVTGTNVGTDSYNNLTWGVDIDNLLYLYSVYYGNTVIVNSVSNP